MNLINLLIGLAVGGVRKQKAVLATRVVQKGLGFRGGVQKPVGRKNGAETAN